jgi:diguanylate cyclase (GGDEF)-like protein
LAEIAQNSIRPDDYFARYGGEEFCMLLTATTEKEAFELAERLRLAFSEFTLMLGKDRINVTVSIGVADSNDIGLVFEDLVTAADQALYRAKQKGRNQVVTYSSMRANDTL